MREPRRIGTFEQVGAVLIRANTIREPTILTLSINLPASDFQRFDAAHKACAPTLSREAFARLAIETGLPKIQEHAMFDRLNEARRQKDREQANAPEAQAVGQP